MTAKQFAILHSMIEERMNAYFEAITPEMIQTVAMIRKAGPGGGSEAAGLTLRLLLEASYSTGFCHGVDSYSAAKEKLLSEEATVQ
jgi:hypothetical protein